MKEESNISLGLGALKKNDQLEHIKDLNETIKDIGAMCSICKLDPGIISCSL